MQLLDELEKPEPFTLSAWATRRNIAGRDQLYKTPTACSQAPLVGSDRERDAQNALCGTAKSSSGCRPAAEGSVSDPPAMSQAEGAGHVVFPAAAAGDQQVGQTGQPAAVQHARIGGSQEEQPGQQPAALQPECPVEGVMLGSQPQYAGRSPPRLRQEGAPGCLPWKAVVPPGSQSQPLVCGSALREEGWPPGCLRWKSGVVLGSQPRHAEQVPAGGKQQQGRCVKLRL